jgi:N-dimethylarginine dimethylaminohydrolase
MGATFLMSYPPAAWSIRGGENFRSQSRAATNPRAALKEWLKLCDAITHAGGRILIVEPPGETPPLTGLMYTANAGELFHQGNGWMFMLSTMSVVHRKAERELLRRFLVEAGVQCVDAQHVWEGQADVCPLAGNRFILTWGVRSVRDSIEDVRARLPTAARVLEVQLRDPFFHGDTCLNPLVNRGGDTILLAHAGALANRTLPELRNFVGPNIEVLPVEEADALGYACNALCVNGTVLVPTGLSVGLRANMVKRGFVVEELDLPELFGKGGGGPRCLVNQLRGFVISDDSPNYAVLRDSLHALADRYPETAANA